MLACDDLIRFSGFMGIGGKYCNWKQKNKLYKQIGERDKHNKLQGRGISVLTNNGNISIGHGELCPGSYVCIFSYGDVEVGEYYIDAAGRIKNKGIRYHLNGDQSKYDH